MVDADRDTLKGRTRGPPCCALAPEEAPFGDHPCQATVDLYGLHLVAEQIADAPELPPLSPQKASVSCPDEDLPRGKHIDCRRISHRGRARVPAGLGVALEEKKAI